MCHRTLLVVSPLCIHKHQEFQPSSPHLMKVHAIQRTVPINHMRKLCRNNGKDDIVRCLFELQARAAHRDTVSVTS
eukprot:scaffold287_cov337-Pavlova_lutheri.AAC.143